MQSALPTPNLNYEKRLLLDPTVGSYSHLWSSYPQTNCVNTGIIFQVFHPFGSTCIIPIMVLSVLNYKIVMASRQRLSTSNKLFSEIKMAKTMMIIVIVFIILNIPKMSLSLYEVSTIPNIKSAMVNSSMNCMVFFILTVVFYHPRYVMLYDCTIPTH